MRQRLQHVHRHAFTLIEMIVVIIVIGIMASMVVPRLSGSRDREYNLIVEQLGDIVLMFALRVSTSNQPSGLRFNSEMNQLELLAKVEHDGERYWELDPLATPVKLPSWVDRQDAISMYVNGELTDTNQWPITTTPGEVRPLLEVTFDWEDRSALISLPSHSIGPDIWLDGIGHEPLLPIDLDAEGRGREEW